MTQPKHGLPIREIFNLPKVGDFVDGQYVTSTSYKFSEGKLADWNISYERENAAWIRRQEEELEEIRRMTARMERETRKTTPKGKKNEIRFR